VSIALLLKFSLGIERAVVSLFHSYVTVHFRLVAITIILSGQFYREEEEITKTKN
jgi:hypothetical protein